MKLEIRKITVFKVLFISLIILGIGISYQNVYAATYNGVPNVKFEPDSTGRYGPVSDNGKGPAIDTDGKPGISKSEAEKLNNGDSNNLSTGSKHALNSHTSMPSSSRYNNVNITTNNDTNNKSDHSPKHKRIIKTHKVTVNRNKSNKSLKVIHAGLIWTGIVLIGAIIIYCIMHNRKRKQLLKQNDPRK